MKSIIFFVIALVGINTMIDARQMTPEEAEERAQNVMLGGD